MLNTFSCRNKNIANYEAKRIPLSHVEEDIVQAPFRALYLYVRMLSSNYTFKILSFTLQGCQWWLMKTKLLLMKFKVL